MKKLLITILSIIMLFSISLFAVGCDKECTEHVEKWIIDEEATCTEPGIKHSECENCGKLLSIKQIPTTGHNYTILNNDTTNHWYECTCGEKSGVENHTGGTASCIERAVCDVCGESYGELLSHNYTKLEKSETQHWSECTCGAKNSVENHKGGTATYTEKAVCDICGESYGELLEMPVTEGLQYQLVKNDTEYEVIDYIGSSTKVYIPSTHNGKPVTSIGSHAFYQCDLITSVVIGNGVTIIGYAAFDSCSSLTSIEIPNSVTRIDFYTFSDCSSLTSIIIPESVTFIGDCVFDGCDSLQYNTRNGLKYLGNKENPCLYLAGVESETITTATVDDNCRFIGDHAFKYCDSLTSIVIPDSVTSIGYEAFYSCRSLTSIELPTIIKYMAGGTFAFCTSLISIEIPESLMYIPQYTFLGCTSLTSVTFGENSKLTSIDYQAFSSCHSLTSIEIPSTVIDVSACAFEYCSLLTNIEISNSVEYIGNVAFRGCTSLTSIVIPSSVIDMGGSVFYDCESLTTIYCEAQSQPEGWSSYWKSGCSAQVVWGYTGQE